MLDPIRRNAQSWGVKLIFGAIILVFVFWGVGSFTNGNSSVIATVNEQPIGIDEYREAYERSIAAIKQQAPNLDSEAIKQLGIKRQVFQQLVDQTLLLQKARELGLEVSSAEVRKEISQIPAFQNANGTFDTEVYKNVLRGMQMLPASFERDYRNQLTFMKLMETVTLPAMVSEKETREVFDYTNEKVTLDFVVFPLEDYLDQVKVTDEAISKFYEENKGRFTVPAMVEVKYLSIDPASLAKPENVSEQEIVAYYDANQDAFKQEEQVKARHILIQVDKDAAEKDVAAAKKKIEKIWAKIKKGADFATTAKKTSEGPSSVNGGDLGWFTRGRMVPEFEEVVFNLKPGEVSKPVRTDFGWHLIFVEDKKEAGTQPLDEVKPTIARKLAEDNAAERVATVLDEAVGRISTGETLDQVAKELDLNIETSGKMTQQNAQTVLGIKPADAETLFTMIAGKASETPFDTKDGYLIVEKAADVPERTRTLDEMKPQIDAFLKAQEAEKAAEAQAAKVIAKLVDSAQTAKEAKKLDIKTSQPMTRRGGDQALGNDPLLLEDAFNADLKSWFPTPFKTPAGVIIAKRNTLDKPSEELWQQQKAAYFNGLRENKKNQIMGAYMEDLRKNAKIVEVNPQILD